MIYLWRISILNRTRWRNRRDTYIITIIKTILKCISIAVTKRRNIYVVAVVVINVVTVWKTIIVIIIDDLRRFLLLLLASSPILLINIIKLIRDIIPHIDIIQVLIAKIMLLCLN